MTTAGETPAKAPPRRKRRRWLLGLAALAAAALLAAGVVGALRRTPPVPVPAVELADPDPAVVAAYRSARDAVRANPHSATAWGQFGMFLLDYNFYPQARVCLAEAERLDPLEPRWPYYHGLTLVSEDPSQAIADLQRAVERCGDKPDAPRLRLAELLLETGRLDEAEAQLRQASAANPGSARAELDLGRLAAERGDLRGGVEHLRRAAASPYTERNARALLAQLLRRLGDDQAAERERRLAEAGDRPLSWPDPYTQELNALRVGRQAVIDRANELVAGGGAAEARAAVEGLVRDYPRDGTCWLVLGQVCLRQSDFARAEQALRRAVELMPSSVEAHFELATVLLQGQEYAAAGEHFRRAAELKPSSATAWFNLARCRRQLGDDAGAADALRKAVDYRPQFGDAHRELGDLLARRGDRAGAVEHLRLAVELNPEDGAARRRLEEVLRQKPAAAGQHGKLVPR